MAHMRVCLNVSRLSRQSTLMRCFSTTSGLQAKKLSIPEVGDDLMSEVRAGLQYERRQRQNAAENQSAPGQGTNEDLRRYELTMGTRGAVYSPEDLSFEAKKPLQQKARQAGLSDRFEEYQVNPIDEYKAYNLLSEFTTELGRIRTREQTGLSAKNQRRLGKAVRRARALSLLPTTARHPDYNSTTRRYNNNSMNFISRG